MESVNIPAGKFAVSQKCWEEPVQRRAFMHSLGRCQLHRSNMHRRQSKFRWHSPASTLVACEKWLCKKIGRCRETFHNCASKFAWEEGGDCHKKLSKCAGWYLQMYQGNVFWLLRVGQLSLLLTGAASAPLSCTPLGVLRCKTATHEGVNIHVTLTCFTSWWHVKGQQFVIQKDRTLMCYQRTFVQTCPKFRPSNRMLP